MSELPISELPILGQFDFAEDNKEKFQGVNRFNKAFWVDDERVDDFAQYLLDEYQVNHNIRTAPQKVQYFNTLKIIICNLIIAYKSGKSYIAINLGANEFLCEISKYEPIHITRTIFGNLVKWLEEDDYLNLYKSTNNPTIGISSMLEILDHTKDLIDSYELKFKDIFFHDEYRFVQKKDEEKKLVDYEDTEETKHREDILHRYIKLLNASDVTIDNKPISKPVSLNSTFIGKIGSYGRINGGEWMNCKSELRKTIKIDNSSTVEVDINNCSIRLASNINGIDLPKNINLYELEGVEEALVKKISIIMQNINTTSVADGLNKVTGALLNSYIEEVSNRIAIRDIQGGGDGRAVASEKKKYLNINQSNKEIMTANGIPYTRQELRAIVERVYEYHNEFADGWLLCGRGLELQYKESQVAFKVIEKFLELDKVVLTIHDSFITKEEDKELLVDLTIFDFSSFIKP